MSTQNATNTGLGRVLQVVTDLTQAAGSTTAILPTDSTVPQNTEGTEWQTVSINPKKASSLLLIEFNVMADSNAGRMITAALFKDSIAAALAATQFYVTASTRSQYYIISHTISAGSKALQTFKIRYGPGGSGTAYINRRQNNATLFNNKISSVLKVTEIAA